MEVLDKFLRYIAVETTSDPNSPTCPSTPGQKVLGKLLAEELADMGAEDARMDAHGYVYAAIPATPGCENEPVIGLIAHMDTSEDMSGADIRPRIVSDYDGKDILLNAEKNIVMKVSEFPDLVRLAGKTLVVTDGTTLLGGDDKAGVAEIMAAAEYLLTHPEVKHGKVMVGFTPDEEIGRGPDLFDVKGFGADFAYTVDGGSVGGIDYENFNAASAHIVFHGISIHPGSARGIMKNALLIAHEFAGMLPALEIPANTSEREGFYHLVHASGAVEEAVLDYIIRDHDLARYTVRKEKIAKVAAFLNDEWGEGTVEARVEDSYFNMKEKVLPHPEILDRARKAYASFGIEAVSSAIRGGTDGATLSYMGLPCPNLSTGGYNCHGRYEFVCAEEMQTMAEVLLKIVTAE